MNKLEGGQGRPNNPESTRQRNTDPREAGKGVSDPARQPEQAEPQKRSAEGNPLLSPVEQEQKLEVTEREKKLLQVMARVIAHGYRPHLHRESGNEKSIERIMLSYIDDFTSTPSNTENPTGE